MSGYWPEGDLGDDSDGDMDGYDGGFTTECVPTGCQCDCHKPGMMHVSHVVACCDKPPALENDRVAMMLGLVPDKRTPEERLLDVIRTNGKSLLMYHYDDTEH